MIRLSLVAAMGALVPLGAAQPVPVKLPKNLPPLLIKAMAVGPKLRYTGTRIVEFRKGPDTVRHEEHITRDGLKLRVEFPDNTPFAGQVIVEDGSVRKHFFPDKNEIHMLPPRRDEALARLRRLTRGGQNYKFTTDAGATIAGVGTKQIVVKDRSGNVVQRLFIEPRSGLLVKRVLLDPVGTPVGSFEFTKVNLTPRINPGVFRFSRKGAAVVTPTDMLRRNVKDGPFLFRVLEPDTGYRLEFSRILEPTGRSVLMQIYSGNGKRVSLFQLSGSIDADRLKRFARDKATTYSWQSSGRTFVLVGNMPQEELRSLASGLSDRD